MGCGAPAVSSFQEKRVEISVASFRQPCAGFQRNISSQTKRLLPRLDGLAVTLVESKSPEDIALPEDANTSWRKATRTGYVNIEE